MNEMCSIDVAVVDWFGKLSFSASVLGKAGKAVLDIVTGFELDQSSCKEDQIGQQSTNEELGVSKNQLSTPLYRGRSQKEKGNHRTPQSFRPDHCFLQGDWSACSDPPITAENGN